MDQIKKKIVEIAEDNVFSTDELERFCSLLDSYQDGIDRERVEGVERERRVIKTSIQIISGITAAQFGLIFTLLWAAGYPVIDHWWVFISFGIGFVQTLGVLRVKGWLREIPINWNYLSDLLKNLNLRAGKPIPSGITEHLDKIIPENPAACKCGHPVSEHAGGLKCGHVGCSCMEVH